MPSALLGLFLGVLAARSCFRVAPLNRFAGAIRSAAIIWTQRARCRERRRFSEARYLVPMLALLALTLSAYADPPDADCTSTNLNQQEMNACSYQDYQAADVELNAAYAKVAAARDAPGRSLLKKAELAWIAYRDAECTFEADSFRGGSIMPTIENGCLAAITKDRTAALKAAEPG